MISDIHVTGKHLTAITANGRIYFNNNEPFNGMLRYNSGGRIEVFDGSKWHRVDTHSSISLSQEAQTALDWAIEKRQEELLIKKLCQSHPALAEAKENYDLLLALVRENNDKNNTPR